MSKAILLTDCDGTTEMSSWIKFFTDAGLSVGDSVSYALSFTDHRIQRSMLGDLTKEYLSDMGINVVGDIIAILKHAQTIHQSLKQYSDSSNTVTRSLEQKSRRSTAASRMVDHHLGNDPEARPMKEVVTSHKKVHPKSSVFNRLGVSPMSSSTAPTNSKVVITVDNAISSGTSPSSSCNRVTKRAATSTCPDSEASEESGDDDEALPYMGVFKSSRKPHIKRPKKETRCTPHTSHKEATPALLTAGILSPNASTDKLPIHKRLG